MSKKDNSKDDATVASDRTVLMPARGTDEGDKTVVQSEAATRARPPAAGAATQPGPSDATLPGAVTLPGPSDATVPGDASPDRPAQGLLSRSGSPSGSLSGSDWSNPSAWQPTHEGPLGPGTVVKERYVIERQLGEGGMGTVFKVRDLVHEAASDRDPHVAMKVLSEGFRRHPDSLKALHRETRKTQGLAHPNIITVYHFDRDGTTVFMTMELLDGKPLDEVIGAMALSGLEFDEANAIIEQMAEGLAYAHERGFVHADFKPGNVFLCSDNRVKLLDFGIARPARIAGADDDHKTQFDVHSLGALTPGYASVEMLAGDHPAPADDVYALGCVAYELYTGRHPFDRKRANVARDEGLQPEPVKGLSRRRRKALERALCFDRADRFENAGEFLRAFRRPRPLQRWAAAALLLLTVVTAALGVRQLWFNDPTVAFDDLEPEIQQQILTLEQSADEAFELAGAMQEYRNEALDYCLRILELHPDNEAASERVDALIAQWEADVERLEQAGDQAAARRLVASLLKSYPALDDNDVLVELAARLRLSPP
ncbi:MAG: serine/threonine-protein kinase [Pseudomonadota bacterium]